MSDWNTPEDKDEEPKPAESEEATPPEPQNIPDDYMPPTNDGTGFVDGVHAFAKPASPPGITFDLAEFAGDQLRLLSFRLRELHVTHRIEGTSLIVSAESATAVQGVLDSFAPPEPVAPAEPIAPAEPVAPPEPIAPAETVAPPEPPAWQAPPVPAAPTGPVAPVAAAAWAEPEAPAEADAPAAPEAPAEPTDWFQPAAVETAPIVDEPVYERTEPEIIDVPPSEDIDEVIDEADEEDDEIVFDLAGLSAEERRHLTMRLTGAGISHIWEVATDLVVSVEDAPVIESYIDEVRNPDGFGDEEILSFEEDSDVDDEAIYSAMSNLYVAADKLMQKPADEPTAGAFYLAADDVEGLPAPFGFDPRVWAQVLAITTSICDALDAEADPDGIGTDAKTLRQLLVNYV